MIVVVWDRVQQVYNAPRSNRPLDAAQISSWVKGIDVAHTHTHTRLGMNPNLSLRLPFKAAEARGCRSQTTKGC